MEIQKTIQEYLKHATKCASLDKSSIDKKLFKDVFITNGVLFHIDKQYEELYRNCFKALRKHKGFKKELVSETEFEDLLTAKAAEQVKDGIDKSSEIIKSLEELKNKLVTNIVPNYAVFLHNDIDEFNIGPVNCVKSSYLKKLYPEHLLAYKISVSENAGYSDYEFQSNTLELSEFSFIIHLRCSPKRIDHLSQWYVDIALSLLRLHLFKSKAIVGHFPHTGDLDPLGFRERDRKKLLLRVDDKFSLSTNFTNYPYYEISKTVSDALTNTGFNELCDKIFFPEANTVRERVQKALGWMSKARRSEDLPTRFLFFFTSLEALLTESRDAPITDTISRHVATIIGSLEYRHEIYKQVKDLYGIRSQLVHSGNRGVSEGECNQLQYIAETVCFLVMDKALENTTENFQKTLKASGFGTEWNG